MHSSALNLSFNPGLGLCRMLLLEPATEPAPLNYFSYFSEIVDTFVRRRGKHLLVSPMDWALIDS